jgi:hypothetical protein
MTALISVSDLLGIIVDGLCHSIKIFTTSIYSSKIWTLLMTALISETIRLYNSNVKSVLLHGAEDG